MIFKTLIRLVLLSVLLISCENVENYEPVKTQIPESFVVTRSGEGEGLWVAGDKITLFSSTESAPFMLVYDGSAWKSDNSKLPLCRFPAKFFAVFPASGSDAFTLPADQSTSDKLLSADWISTDDTELISNAGAPLGLNFKHMFCKVEISIVKYNNEFGGVVPTITNPIFTAGTLKYKRNNGSKGAYANPTESGVTSEIKPLFTQSSDGMHKIEAMLPPGNYTGSWFTIYVNGAKLKVVNAQSINMEGGKTYKMNLTVGKEMLALNLNNVSDFVTAWDREVPIDFIAPKIGDYLYDDGTWGAWTTSKKAIGVVFSNNTTQNDKDAGYYNGYAIALNEVVANQFKTTNTTDGYGNMGWNPRSFASTIEQNRDGLTYSISLYNDEHPAVKAAYNYKNRILKDISSWASRWFIPGFGQWCEVIINLGGAPATPSSAYSTYVTWNYSPNNLNTYFEGKSGAIGIKGGEYWTSSYNNDRPHQVSIGYSDFVIQTQSNTSKFKVRPAIAF